jgi:Ca2+-binding RTX toxin-like protein
MLVFTPEQLEQVLSDSVSQGLTNALDDFLGGTSTGADSGIALAVGNDVVETGIGNSLPPLASGSIGNGNTVVSTAADDTLTAQSGNNVLVGLGENATLVAGSGSDLLMGGAGNDVLKAGTEQGAQTFMWGGAGNDTFVFAANAAGTQNHTVLDFQHGIDQVEFDNVSFTSFAELQEMMHAAGSDTVIEYGAHDSVTLKGVTPGILSAADFIIHHA